MHPPPPPEDTFSKSVTQGCGWACGCLLLVSFVTIVVPLVFLGGTCAWLTSPPDRNTEPASPSSSAPATAPTAPSCAETLRVIEHKSQSDGSNRFIGGIVENVGENDCFNVHIEYPLNDKSGSLVGTADDFTPVVYSSSRWKFKAYVYEKEANMPGDPSLTGVLTK